MFGSQRRRGAAGGEWRVASGASPVRGFSLVEVTVAIGIFAFVAVGILGLLPAAMRLSAESAQETRAVMIAQELFSAVASGPSLLAVNQFRDGPGLTDSQSFWPPEDLTSTSGPIVFGYVAGTSVPLFAAAQKSRTQFKAEDLWDGSSFPDDARNNDISMWARLEATKLRDNLYSVTVQVRAPASATLEQSERQRSVYVFTTYMTAITP